MTDYSPRKKGGLDKSGSDTDFGILQFQAQRNTNQQKQNDHQVESRQSSNDHLRQPMLHAEKSIELMFGEMSEKN